MKKLIYLYFGYAIFLSQVASATDLYLFFIHGDAKYHYRGCENGATHCKEKNPLLDSSNTIFNKAKELSESCSDCDVAIFYVKPYSEKVKISSEETGSFSFSSKKTGGTLSLVQTTIFVSKDKKHIMAQNTTRFGSEEAIHSGQMLFYSNGALLEKTPIVISKKIPRFVPVIGNLAWITRGPEEFSRELKILDKNAFSQGRNYNKQFAFYFGHKIPDDTHTGFFHSNEVAEFSMNAFLTFAKEFSKVSNGKNRLFDALFLLNCATGMSTVYEIYKKDITSLLLAHPPFVALGTMASWDLLSLGEHLSSNNETHESIKTFFNNSFSPEDQHKKESLSYILHTSYAVSLYDLDQIKNERSLEKALEEGAKISKRIGKKIGEDIKKWASGIANDKSSGGVELKHLRDESWKNVDCALYPEIHPILEKLAPSLRYKHYFKAPATWKLSFKPRDGKTVDFSGWSCL